jgi:hypothetical protein
MRQVQDYLLGLNLGTYPKTKTQLIKQPKAKKIKKYPMFKLTNHSGSLISTFKYGKREDWMDHYGINKTNKIVGFLPDYIGFQDSRIIQNDNLLTKFCIDNFSEIKNRTSKTFFDELKKSSIDTRIVYSGGYDTCHSHLREFFKDNNSEDVNTTDSIINILEESNFKWFYSPKVDFYDTKELDFFVKVNLDAHPGHYTGKLIHSQKRYTNILSRQVAKRLYSLLRKIPYKNFYLWDVLGREKDIKLEKGVKEVGTRVVLNNEDPMVTLLMWFSQKMQLALESEENKTFNVVGNFGPLKYSKIYENESKYDYKLEADWTFFDSNVDTQYIEAACAILLSGLPDDTLHTHIKYLITKSIVTKYVAVPPGIVVELNRGVPSGHPFTTLINCTVNTIYWSLIGREIYGPNYHEKMKVEVYGDDTYAYFTDNDNLNNIDVIIKNLGLKSEPIRDELKLCNYNYKDKEKPDFLKRRFSYDTIKWNSKKFFDKIFYQSKKRNFQDQTLLLLSYYETAPHDDDMLEFLKIFKDFINKHDHIRTKISSDTIKLLEDYTNSNVRSNKIRKQYSLSAVPEKGDPYNRLITIMKIKGIFIKFDSEMNEFFKNNSTQSELIYSLGFPLDLVSKNKFILTATDDNEKIYFYDEEFLNDYKEYTQQIQKKISNQIRKKY